jgi:hypothetical protein
VKTVPIHCEMDCPFSVIKCLAKDAKFLENYVIISSYANKTCLVLKLQNLSLRWLHRWGEYGKPRRAASFVMEPAHNFFLVKLLMLR